MLIPTQTQRLRPATVKPQQVMSKPIVRFQADSSNTSNGPYSLSQTELDKLSLKEKQQLFAKLPLLKYQGKTLSGSEFLKLLYRYPYPEKNAWVTSSPTLIEVEYDNLALMLFGILTAGIAPLALITADNYERKIPLIPRKGVSKQAFEAFCKNLTSLKNNPINPIQVFQLFCSLGLTYSHYYDVNNLKSLPEYSPITLTREAKRLLKNPLQANATLVTLNNHTFANLLEKG